MRWGKVAYFLLELTSVIPDVGYIHDTTTLASSDTPVTYTGQWPTTTYFVSVDHAVRVRRSPVAHPQVATINDFPIPAGGQVLMRLFQDEQFSFVLEDGETDGSIWVTPTDIG